ncbi:Signal recognition particle receptor subunit alpha [Dirofilaria immitis]
MSTADCFSHKNDTRDEKGSCKQSADQSLHDESQDDSLYKMRGGLFGRSASYLQASRSESESEQKNGAKQESSGNNDKRSELDNNSVHNETMEVDIIDSETKITANENVTESGELKTGDTDITRDQNDFSIATELNEEKDAEFEKRQRKQTQESTVTIAAKNIESSCESKRGSAGENHIKIIEDEKGSIPKEKNDSLIPNESIIMVSAASEECPNGPGATSNIETNNTIAEEIGKMESNKKDSKNRSEEQKDVRTAQETPAKKSVRNYKRRNSHTVIADNQFAFRFNEFFVFLSEKQSFFRDDEVNEEKNHDGWFLALRSLVGNKKLTAEDIKPVLDKMRETLIAKNVAAEPAEKLCQSVEVKLEGKVIGTFSRVASIVKESVREALVQLLTPKRRVDLLRDILEAKNEKRPYIIVFCGVNGVGKSTNLAKITFWLNENGHKVLIAAADTFRAGAVEQLRTHTKHLNALHANSVQLYEQGYGKDPAGLAAAAISIAAERGTDVVLVDTAGRMQDNEPLMRSLAKLIQVNKPDLVLFVGEALVGNEAVDQLVKFNQALADHAALGSEGRLIDGIVLTKFDTIDDKVGAAISMTYVTGQPIVFVGTGQTYKDLKSLNASAVVHSLLK